MHLVTRPMTKILRQTNHLFAWDTRVSRGNASKLIRPPSAPIGPASDCKPPAKGGGSQTTVRPTACQSSYAIFIIGHESAEFRRDAYSALHCFSVRLLEGPLRDHREIQT